MRKFRLCLLIIVAAAICFAAALPFGTAYAETERKVYIGGYPIGIAIDVGGLLVDNVTGVETEYGTAYVEGLRRGDIIKKINGSPVRSVDDVEKYLEDGTARLEIVRGGDTIETEVKPIVEAYSAKPRLGVKIKDKLYGVGTLSFGALNRPNAARGHEIYDSETNTHIPFCSGKIHGCKILGIKHGGKGEAGALLGSISANTEYGTITCNNRFGIGGEYSSGYSDELLPVAERGEVKPGAAQIRTTVSDKPEYFDIEIIKASRQNGRREKGIVFRVTDKRLLELTGGVVRGMSGSPIVQNGKLVGAVTHVFLNDFTKGYGVYADFLN